MKTLYFFSELKYNVSIKLSQLIVIEENKFSKNRSILKLNSGKCKNKQESKEILSETVGRY